MGNDDLYDSTGGVTPAQPINSGSSQGGFELFDGSWIDLSSIIYWLNVIVLAWTIVYSLILIADFVFYRIKFPEGEVVSREEKGVKAMNQAAGLWWGFLICAILYLWYFTRSEGIVRSLIGWVTASAYIFKVVVIDMPNIPVIGKYIGKPGEGISEFFNKFGENMKKFFGSVVDGITSVFGSNG